MKLAAAAARVPPALRGQRVYFEIGGGPYAAGTRLTYFAALRAWHRWLVLAAVRADDPQVRRDVEDRGVDLFE